MKMLKASYRPTWDNTTASRKITRTTKHGGRCIRQTPGYLQKLRCPVLEETGVQLPWAASYDGADTWTLNKREHFKLAAAQTKTKRSMLDITYKDRKTTSGSRRGQVIDITV